MTHKTDSKNAPIKQLVLNRQTVKNLGVRSAVRTGGQQPAANAARPVVSITRGASCPSGNV